MVDAFVPPDGPNAAIEVFNTGKVWIVNVVSPIVLFTMHLKLN